jgi:hypothetical protein
MVVVVVMMMITIMMMMKHQLMIFSFQVENCSVTITSDLVGAIVQNEVQEGGVLRHSPQHATSAAADDFPALGKSAAAVRKEKPAKTKDQPSPPPPAPPAPPPPAPAVSQVTVLLDAEAWSLKMASLDALR